jgi:alpha-tubulin suppressor-like RCC1 family protein
MSRIACGVWHSVALKSDGSLVSWGRDTYGQVSGTPSGNDFVSVCGGDSHSLALKSDGSLISWGSGSFGQVTNTPTSNDFAGVSCGNNHSLALKTDGSITGWGDNNKGQISNIPSGNDFEEISSGASHGLALKSDGSLVSWGNNDYGQVNDTPSGNDFIAIGAGDHHSVALKSDGSLVAWGRDLYGQVSGTPSGNDFVDIKVGYYHSVALKSDGSLIAWGYDANNEVTDTPTGNDFVTVACGPFHSLALKLDGSIVAWGNDTYNQVSGTPTGNDFIEIMSKYLLRNNLTNQVYTITNGSLDGVGGAISPQHFLQSWWDDDAFTDLSLITQDILDQMQDDEIQICEYDASAPANKNITIGYIPHPQLVLPSGNIDISSITNIDSFSLTANTSGSADLKIIISIDEGVTYKTFNGSIWETVDHTDLSLVKTNGMTVSEFNALTSTQIMDLVGAPDKIKFGYYMELTDPGETCETDELSLQVDMNGEWEKAEHMVDYNYAYLNSTTLQIELFSNGDFKINY